MKDELILKLDGNLASQMRVLFCGHQKCSPLYSFGPGIHSSFIIHVIINGKGRYIKDGKEYALKQNDIFLITPTDLIFYEADEQDPWEYVWMAIDGEDVQTCLERCGISKKRPAMALDNSSIITDFIFEMISCEQVDYAQELRLQGLMYQCLSKIAQQIGEYYKHMDRNNLYIEQAIQYITHNYHKDISVSDIAEYISLNRCYFSHSFRKSIGVSPSEFLMEFRISKAEELIRTSDLTIYEIANLCGYNDQSSFSKAFKRLRGISPTEYKIIKTS